MKVAFPLFSRFFSLTMLSGVAGMAGIITLLIISLTNEHREADIHVQFEMGNISRLLEEHTLATVQKVDLLLRDLRGHVRPDEMRLTQDAGGTRAVALHAMLESRLETAPEVGAFHLINAQGQHLYSSLNSLPLIDISDRDYFIKLRDNASAGLVISAPVISRTTGKWTLVLGRRLNFKNGSFAGVAIAVMDMEHFQKLFTSLNLDAHGVVALYDRELRLAARFPPSENDMGKTIHGLSFEHFLDRGIRQGIYHAKSPLDGIERLVSFRQVGDLPLIITVGLAEQDYLAAWHRHVWQYTAGALIFGLGIIGLRLRQQRLEEELREDDSRFRYMLETSPIAVRIASATGRKVLFANQRYAELIEAQPDQVVGVDPKNYYTNPKDYEDALQSLSRGESVTNKLIEMLMPAGGKKWALASYLNLKYGKESAVLGWFYDITERKAAEEKIRKLAFYDSLTQLPNRLLLNDRLGQAIAASQRSKRFGALMFLDLDNFKSLNDTEGHGVGDLLLIEVARRTISCVRETDTVSRFGGDEFVVVLKELDSDETKSKAQAATVAEKIRKTLAEPYVLKVKQEEKAEYTVEHRCTASIGVVVFVDHQTGPEDILKWADIAMYQAKEGGRNKTQFYESKG